MGSGNSEQRGSKSSPGSPASLSYRSYNSTRSGSDSEGHRQGTGMIKISMAIQQCIYNSENKFLKLFWYFW